MLRTSEDRTVLSYSIFSIILFVFYLLMFRQTIRIFNRRLFTVSLPFAFLFSVLTLFGTELSERGNISFSSVKLYLEIIIAIPFFISCISLLLHYYPVILDKLYGIALPKWYLKLSNSKYYLFFIWGFIFFWYLICLLIYFPGTMCWDASGQIRSFLDKNVYDLHPIASTYLFSLFWIVGLKLFSSYGATIFLYSLVQSLAVSFLFAYFCKKFFEYKIPVLIQFLLISFFSFNYVIGLYAIYMEKTIVFSVFFCLLIFEIYNAVNTSGFFTANTNIIKLIILVFLSAAFRLNASYAIIVFSPFFFYGIRNIYHGAYTKKILLVIIPLILFGLGTGPLEKLLHVKQGVKINIIVSVPAQQLSRVARDKWEFLSDTEKEKIAYYIPKFKDYDPVLADFVRATEKTKSKDFIMLWIKLGLKFPSVYINAFLEHTYYGWYPAQPYKYFGSAWSNHVDFDPQGRSHFFPDASISFPQRNDFVVKGGLYVHHNIIQRVPVISLFTRMGIYFWGLLLFFAFCVYYKQYRLILPGLLMLIYVGTFFIGPVVSLRYAAPLLFIAPLFLAIISRKEFYAS
jgi:hypothetical protein